MTIANFFRAACALIVTVILGLGTALILNLALLLANYLSLEVSFEMLGLDSTPLGNNKLLGVLFTSLVPEASLTNLVALCLAGVVCLGFFVCTRLSLQLFDHFKQLRLHRGAGNPTGVEAYRWLIAENLVYLSVFLPLILGFSIWDLELFRFRAVIGAAQASDAQTALSLPTWATVAREGADLYAITLAKVGMWGYVSVNVMASLLLEWMLKCVRTQFIALVSEVEGWFRADENGTHVAEHEPTGTVAEEGGDSKLTADAPTPEPEVPARPRLAPDAPVEPIREAKLRTEELRPTGPARELREVIGGATDERVSIEEALRNPERYHVEVNTGMVWSRAHWQVLHATEEEKYAGAAQ